MSDERPTARGVLRISNRLGLHARAAGKLAKLAERFESDVRVSLGEDEVDAKSIMGLMMLGAAQGTDLAITAEGADATAAIEAIEALVDDKFGEGE